MKRFRKTLGANCLRRAVIYFLAYCVLFNTSLPVVLATPTPDGDGFTAGTTGEIEQVGNATNVLVYGAESVIEWTSLDTDGGESLKKWMHGGVSLRSNHKSQNDLKVNLRSFFVCLKAGKLNSRYLMRCL